jgi:YggT family protein
MVLDAVSYAQQFIDVFIYVYILAILLWVLLSWFRVPYSLLPVQRFLSDLCDPYLRMWRRILPGLGPLDLSPLVGIVVLVIAQRVIDALLGQLH